MSPIEQVKFQKAIEQTDAIFALEGFKPTEQRKAIRAAVMAGRVTNEQAIKEMCEYAMQLKSIEYEVTSARAEDILTGEISLGVSGYGLERQAAIHKHLFQDVYEWGGKTRPVPSSKRAENGMVALLGEDEAIAKDWQELEKKTREFVAGRGLSFEHKRAL